MPDLADLTAVVPVRNQADLLDGCLAALRRSGLAEVIVVDGCSTDNSVAVAQAHGATVLSDQGRGLPYARSLGARHAGTTHVALVDADVLLGATDLQALLAEFESGRYAGLQAGLLSTSGPGYWGRALVAHHRSSRSREWFGVVATILERDVLLDLGFDQSFLSGEDIELRWRMKQRGHKVGVSRTVMVEHRFAGDDFEFAKSQFLADGQGLGRLVLKQRLRGVGLLALPLLAAIRGTVLHVARGRVDMVPYFVAFAGGNYAGMARALADGASQAWRRGRAAASRSGSIASSPEGEH